MRFLAFAVVLSIGFAAQGQEQPSSPPPVLPTPTQTSEELAALRAQVERLARELDAERQARLAGEAAALKEAREAKAVAVAPPATGISLRAGALSVRFGGLLQADGVLFRESSQDEVSPATGEPLNQTRFLIRRARLRAEIDYKFLAGAIELDANTVRGPTVRLLSGWAGIRWPNPKEGAPPYLALTVGLQRIPFGGELREPARHRFFLERSNVVQALFPSAYDLGAVVQGGWRFLRYAAAAMNGNPVSDSASAGQFQARDPNQSKDFLGRLGVDLKLGSRVALAGGISALYGTGFHTGTPGTKDVLVWRDIDENGIVALPEIQVIPGVAGAASQNFDRYAAGGDLRVTVLLPRLGELVLYGELIWATNLDRGRVPSDPIAAGRTLRQLGGYVAATLELTRWAQVGVRYDTYNPDADAIDQRGFIVVPKDASFSTVSVGVAGRWTPYGRLLLEYDHNDNALGRTASGLPTTLADDALTLRAQVQF